MKNKLLILGIAVLFSVTACQKDDSAEMLQSSSVKQSKPNSNSKITTTTPVGWGKNLHWVGAPHFDCYVPAVDCYDEVVITSPKFAEITTCVSGGATTVGSYFNGTDWHTYMPGLLDSDNSATLTDLQSGDYYFEEETNTTTGHKFILVKDVNITEEQDPKYVFEFTIEDDIVIVN
jgi:hypothetical protein